MSNHGWIGVDLDGTLAYYDGWVSVEHIGEPVPAMLERVKAWLAEGREVRIFTARVGPQKDVNDAVRAREAIESWCQKHLGQVLPITATKDFAMVELWDDRCVQVVPNTGIQANARYEVCVDNPSPPYFAKDPRCCPKCSNESMLVLVTYTAKAGGEEQRTVYVEAGYGACPCGFQNFVEDASE